MTTLHATRLLEAWERGLRASGPARALLLLSATEPREQHEFIVASVGETDARLLALHEALFGTALHGYVDCRACGERLELTVDTRGIRLDHDQRGAVHTFAQDGYVLRFRSLRSADLLALRPGMPSEQAERTLLAHCLLEARWKDSPIALTELPESVISALSLHMAELDPQAEVVLEAQCAACAHMHQLPLDIATHTWSRVDRWARGLLRDIHLLASAYGWSERSIVRMSAGRREAYLAQLGDRGAEGSFA